MTLQQPPLADCGLIGDMRTAALVGRHGGIDWCCLPRFDSASVFAAILDPVRGGTWQIQPAGEFVSTQAYRESTNVLSDRTDKVVTLASAKPFDWIVEHGTATAGFSLAAGERRVPLQEGQS